ncbi:MAG: pyridoxamine 5'-phosphate oxidase family protein [Ruminococcus sp.]|nr:pyridoxamine 5'-phosphate oxidase family protein [Ruminococcus sp.]
MFRDLARKKQQISDEECISILKSQLRGVLSVVGDNGYPYTLPINHFYNDEDGKIYFHSGKKGHKIDALNSCDKASFCVYDEGYRKDGDWALNIKSVIVFGRVRLIEDYDRVVDISRKLSYKFTSDDSYIDDEIERFANATVLLELTPEHITGKLVNEA